MLAVADGVGECAATRPRERRRRPSKRRILSSSNKKSDSLRSAILNGIDAANRTVLELGVGAASTLAVVEIQGHTIRPYHVGDSMILNVGQRGKIKLQRFAFARRLCRRVGTARPEAAMHHAQRHIVSNVIGSADMRIEIGSTITLSPRDTLVLASDGLSDNLHVNEIIESIRKGPLETGVRQMAREIPPPHDFHNAGSPVKAGRHDDHRLSPHQATEGKITRTPQNKTSQRRREESAPNSTLFSA